MRVTILGCGTATGVPMIGCDCPVCTSDNPRNRRSRSSIVVQREDGKTILFDTSPDLWAQATAHGLCRLDAVVFTHPHADHIHGIDELRSFNFVQDLQTIPCYGSAETLLRLREGFGYLFAGTPHSPYARPRISLHEIDEQPFELFGQAVVPLPVEHGPYQVLGFRLDDLAYVTDASALPEATRARMQGLQLLILGALRPEPHPKHFSVAQALEAIAALRPHRALLTHMSHKIDYDACQLPEGVALAYDGQVIDL